ncbi:C40 family peptidase [Planomonospora sp. ID91781]|uniref:C40 family peptidase n=1 Tax=Planomonospora sp. ID91781 TaxID=2738135 RepID=UPI0018C44F03|nr:C40 family peptidase [Planomonospora sp. ID91781]
MSLMDIVARVGQLEAQFGAAPAATAASATSAADFAAALKTAQRSGAASGTTASGTTAAASGSAAAAGTGQAAQGTQATRAASAADAVTGGSGGVTGQDVVDQARKYLGVPYLWGGTDPKRGLDCSGLVQLVYKKLGVSLPRVSQDQQNEGRSIPSLKQALPGDLLTFGSPATHIGIYIGDGKMLHAPRTGDVVKIVDMDDYYRKPTDIRRVLSDAAAGATPAAASPTASSTASPAAVRATTATASAFRAAASPAAVPLTATPTAASTAVPTTLASVLAQTGALPGTLPGALSGFLSGTLSGTGAGTGTSAELAAAMAAVQAGYGAGATSFSGSAGLPQMSLGAADELGNGLFDPAQAYVRTIQPVMNGIG